MDTTHIRHFAARRPRQRTLPDRAPASDPSLDIVRLHGTLHYAYTHCIGNRTLKAGFWPARKRWYTFALWTTTALQLAVFPASFIDTWWQTWGLFVEMAITLGLFVPLGRYCIRRELAADYSTMGITGQTTSQPGDLHMPILRLLWFQRDVARHGNPGHDDIKKCLEFAELTTRDAPPSWTSYFRQPVVVCLVGLGVAALNVRISQSSQIAPAEAERHVLHTLEFVLRTLGAGLLLYAALGLVVERRWSFLRCLRWLELSIRP